MNRYGLFLYRLYSGLLCFYPRLFRNEFASEMQAVFDQGMVEAAGAGQVAIFFMHELRDWPLSVLRAHLQERRLLNMNNPSVAPPLRWWEVLVGIGIFLLAILWESSSGLLPDGVNRVALITLFIFLVAVILVGIFKGLPRWCLPSFGLFFGRFRDGCRHWFC